jgi:hypothetical protein
MALGKPGVLSASVCLVWCLQLCESPKGPSSGTLVPAGSLTGVGILLLERFVPFERSAVSSSSCFSSSASYSKASVPYASLSLSLSPLMAG